MDDPDPTHAATDDELARCLRQLHVLADRPSLRALEEQTGKTAGSPLPGTRLKSVRLGRTPLNDMLRGLKFPKKAFMLTFVNSCGVDLAIDQRWEAAWNRLANQYASQSADKEGALLQEITALRARAEQAETENKQLRQEIAAILIRAEQAGTNEGQVRQEVSIRTRPKRSVISQPTLESLRRWDPDQIGPFALLGRLGAGAMGQVYLGRSTAGRLVAVKTIKIELARGARLPGQLRPGGRRRAPGQRRVHCGRDRGRPRCRGALARHRLHPGPLAKPPGPGLRPAAGSDCAVARRRVRRGAGIHSRGRAWCTATSSRPTCWSRRTARG
jgi:hypothetical protein